MGRVIRRIFESLTASLPIGVSLDGQACSRLLSVTQRSGEAISKSRAFAIIMMPYMRPAELSEPPGPTRDSESGGPAPAGGGKSDL
jgi:hypothetical protein